MTWLVILSRAYSTQNRPGPTPLDITYVGLDRLGLTLVRTNIDLTSAQTDSVRHWPGLTLLDNGLGRLGSTWIGMTWIGMGLGRLSSTWAWAD